MDEQQFNQQVDAFFLRLDGLLVESSKEGSPDGRFSQQAIEELQILAEELQVASEELRQKNEELSEANAIAEDERQRYQDLFEFAPDGYLVTDSVGKILEANRAAAQLLQMPAEFLHGKPIAIYIFGEDVMDFRARLSDISGRDGGSPGASEHWEVRIKPRDGYIFDASLTVAAVRQGVDKDAVSLRWLLRDNTERNQARKALQAAKDELEQRVVDRTAQLTQANTNLKRFAKDLEQKNRELQDFAFIASHDLQEPLRKIQAFGSLLASRKQEALGDEGIDYIRRMVAAAARMQTMILELLQYARVTTKGSPFQVVNLSQVAAEVLADLETRISQSGGQVEVGDLPMIEADPLQMRQLMQNLIANALKFHHPDLEPVVKVLSQVDSPHSIVFYVQDNGIGMDPQYQKLIFKPFHRLHGRSEYEGIGMGLSICRKIVERHGGKISVKSRLGEGTTFFVQLPVTQENSELNQDEG